MSEAAKQPVTPLPAATILLLRDSEDGALEVFMVKRHHQIDFMAGALVFPGGKLEKGDSDPALAEFSDGGEGWSAEMRAMAAAAIREAFEESGILIARDTRTGEMVHAHRLEELQHYRSKLDKREISLIEVLRSENLKLALDHLVHYAHWITPANVPKRFDTHFFLASSPAGHEGAHDGRESVDSVWITPHEAITNTKKWSVVFPTKLNLMKLDNSKSVAGAMAAAKADTIVTVLPRVEQTANGPVLHIPKEAGYAITEANMKDAL